MISFCDELQREEGPRAAKRKKNVYLIQYNTPSSRNLVPLAAGLLYSYAKIQPRLLENYNFRIETLRGAPEEIIACYPNPHVVALSLYFWNFNQSLSVAKVLKLRYPNLVIIVGGPSAPLHEADVRRFFEEHPYIDISIAGEGEIIFSDLLTALIDGTPAENVSGLCLRRADGSVLFQEKRPYIKDISVIPSPFLDGTFDELLDRLGDSITGVVWETNRGCPFTCTFCFWGGPDSKISQFPVERVYAELDWIAKNKIAYIFGADANFGVLKRDVEIARYMAKLNRETGFPKFFVINWTKNATERIFEIVDALKESEVKFMMTTSVQSHNPETLQAIKRQNIKLESFQRILEEANKRNFNTYSELILGLPLETYHTFVDGLRKVLVPVLHYHFNVYCCVLIPGTAMADPDYVKKYAIKTKRCVMNLGRTIHAGDAVPEYQDLVIETSTMPVADWKRAHSVAYMTKAIYGFRLGFFVLNFLRTRHAVDILSLIEAMISRASQSAEYPSLSYALRLLDQLQNSILSNGNETISMPGVKTSLHPEMAALLTLLSDKQSFFREFDRCVRGYCAEHGIALDEDMYQEAMAYQYARTPSWTSAAQEQQLEFCFYTHESDDAEQPANTNTRVLTLGCARSYLDADDFLRQQIYGGMIFSLLPSSAALQVESDYASGTGKPVESAALFYARTIGTSSTNGLATTQGDSRDISVCSPQ